MSPRAVAGRQPVALVTKRFESHAIRAAAVHARSGSRRASQRARRVLPSSS